MSKASELNIQFHWHQSAENAPKFAQDNLLALVKFLARRAAERDHQAENINGKGDNDT